MTNNILITGGTGMVGNALRKIIPDAIFVSSKEYDLRDQLQTKRLFYVHKPDYVIHLAAKVGGVKGNMQYMADYYADNIQINTNVLKEATNHKVRKVISMLSTCVYPDAEYVTYPLTEDQLHLGEPSPTNYGYAYSKRMLEVQSRAYCKQYPHGTKFLCAIPNNIFGEHDNFDLENGHVAPAVIRKIWEAKKYNKQQVAFWGDGSSLREFTYAHDIAKALLFTLWNVDDFSKTYNIGNTEEISIKTLVEKVARIMEYGGEIIWDTGQPSGQFRKPSSNKKFLEVSDFQYTNFDIALKNTCQWFKKNYPNVRGAL